MAEKTYLHSLYPNLLPQIDEAIQQGYSLQEVHDHIGAKINDARRNGYSDTEIQRFTGAIKETPKSYNPFLAQFYTAASALNNGIAGMFERTVKSGVYAIAGKDPVEAYYKEKLKGTDLYEKYNQHHGVDTSSLVQKFIDNATIDYKQNAEYYDKMAKEEGANIIDRIMGSAIGGAPTGILEFKMGVPYAAALGGSEARSQGQNEIVAGIMSAAKRAILGKLFHWYGQLSKPLASPMMGITMGSEIAAGGGTVEQTAEATGTGFLYGLGGRGRIGIKEIREINRPVDYKIEVRQGDPVDFVRLDAGKVPIVKDVDGKETPFDQNKQFMTNPKYYEATLKAAEKPPAEGKAGAVSSKKEAIKTTESGKPGEAPKESYESFIKTAEGEGPGAMKALPETKLFGKILDLAKVADVGLEEAKIMRTHSFQDLRKVRTILNKTEKTIDEMITKADQISRAAYASGNREGAFYEHQKMMAIKKNRDEINRAFEQEKKEVSGIINRIKRNSELKKLDPDYREQIAGILEDYELKGRSDKVLTERELTRDFVKRMEAAGEVVLIPEEKLALLSKKNVNDVSIEELRNLDSIVKHLSHLGLLKNKLLASKTKRDFNQAKTDLIDEAIEGRYKRYPALPEKPLPPSGRQGTFRERVWKKLDSVVHSTLKVELITDMLSGFKGVNSRAYERLFKPVVVAENDKINRSEIDTKQLKKNFDSIRDSIKDKTRKDFDGFSVTRSEAIMVALNSGNEGNRNALRKGFGLEDSTINKIVDSLNAKEKAFVENTWNQIEGHLPDVSKVFRKLTGEKMTRVEGRYFPLYFDRELSDMVLRRSIEEDLMKDVYTRTAVGRGFTIERKGGTDAPLLDLKVIPLHIEKVNHFVSHALAVRDIQKMILDPKVKGTIEASLGPGAYKEFMPWLKSVANPRGTPMTEVDKVAGMLRNNASIVSLGLKFSTMVMQPMAYFQTINRLGLGNAMAGLKDFYKNPLELKNKIYELSPFMRNRWHSFDRDLKDFIDDYGKKNFLKNSNMIETFYYGLTLLDLATTLPSWHSAYTVEMKKTGGNIAKSIEQADAFTRQTASSGMPKDLARIQRGPELQKSFVMFYTFFSSTLNEFTKDVEMAKSGEGSVGKVAASFMYLFIIPAVITAYIKSREDTDAKKVGQELVQNMAASIPVVGSVLNAAVSGYDYQASPIFEAPNELIKTFTSKDSDTKLRHGVMALGYGLGLPSRQAILAAQYLGDAMENRSYDPMNLVYREKKKKGTWQ